MTTGPRRRAASLPPCPERAGPAGLWRARARFSAARALLAACAARALLAACAATALLAACAVPVPPADWETRLRGDAIVLLGEVHDNERHHRLRLQVLERAIAAGWRPAIAMEQFDRERQAEIDRARAERPLDADHLIAQASPPPARAGAGWNWPAYRPYVELALRHGLPLVAANLSNSDTTRIVRNGYAAVFDPAAQAALGLDRPVPADWQATHERQIDAGHCGALPASVWPRMARAQLARDPVMAQVLRQHGGQGIVLLAGDGHVRRDIGVPRWLTAEASRVFVVGLLERDDGPLAPGLFDAVVHTEPADRADPCIAFKAGRAASRPAGS